MRLDHVAHPCRDPEQTHRFYTDVLGLKLVQAYASTELLLVYALPDGGSLAFSTAQGDALQLADKNAWERKHVGLMVATRAEFESWLKRLKELGIDHDLVNDERIYFADPNGLMLELEVDAPTKVNPAAHAVLTRWQKYKMSC